jgi:putative two-component system response regulator
VVSRIDGCSVAAFTDPIEALAEAANSRFDVALVDYVMPQVTGIEFIGRVRALPGCDDLPVVIVTTHDERTVRNAALEAGATDFLTKPIDPAEVKSRIRNILKLRESQVQLRDKASWLAGEVRKATDSLAAREEEIILRLSRAAEHRDIDTGTHIVRMAKYCRLIAEALGLDDGACRTLYLAAPMHDVGKIAIGDAILLKPGKLTPEERAVMEQHTTYGFKILADSNSDLIRVAAEIAWCHHERWDGSGYPRGLAGDEIPLFSRIAAVADVFDALTSERPYKQAWSALQARAHIVENSGKHFDPSCVAAFLKRWDDILRIHNGNQTETRAVA